MAEYVSRNVTLATAYQWDQMTLTAGETRGDVIVPPGMHSIKQIWLAPAASVFTDAKGCIIGFRIRGLGFQYETVAGGVTNSTIAVKDGYNVPTYSSIIETNIQVEPGQSLTLEANQISASDCGTADLGVTLVFDSSSGEKRWSFLRFSASLTGLDTKTVLNLDGIGGTVGAITFPGGTHHITNILAAPGGITLATATGGNLLVRLEGGIKDGDVVIPGGSNAQLNTNDGAGVWVWNPLVLKTDMEIEAGAQCNAFAEQTGVDWGTVYAAVAVEVA